MKDKAIKIIKEELEKRKIKIIKILLFGSRVRGDFKLDSDWDFYVIVEQNLTRDEKWEIILEIKRRLAKLKIPNDIFINSQTEVNQRKNDVGCLTYYVLKEGIEV